MCVPVQLQEAPLSFSAWRGHRFGVPSLKLEGVCAKIFHDQRVISLAAVSLVKSNVTCVAVMFVSRWW